MNGLEKTTVQQYERLLLGIAEASMLLLNGSDFKDAVTQALRKLGDATNTDRTYVFAVSVRNGEPYLNYSFEWVAHGIEPQINNEVLRDVHEEDVEDSIKLLKSGQVFKGHTRELPQDSKTAVFLKLQQIKSVLLVPVFVHKKFWGFVGYDSCRSEREWLTGEENLLKCFSAIISKSRENFASKKSLKETNKLLRLVTENSQDIIALLGNDLGYKFLSPSVFDVLGYTSEELKVLEGKAFLKDDTARKAVLKLSEQAGLGFEKQLSETFTHKAKHKNGRTVYLETTITVVRESQDDEMNMQVISRDVTEKVILERDKEENQKKERELINLRSLFVSMASHQFRTPLAVIHSNLDLIRITLKKYGFPADAQNVLDDAVSRVNGQIANMTDLMSDMLLLGEFQERGLQIKAKHFLLQPLVDEVVQEIKVVDSSNHTFNVMGDDVEVFADRNLIKHALVNLVENACKYSPGQSVVQLFFGFDQKREFVFIEVKDSGIGISNDDLQSVTSTFFRGKNTGDIKGTGLGLAIVNEFVGIHGGKLEIDSELQKGTVVRIILPHKKARTKNRAGFQTSKE